VLTPSITSVLPSNFGGSVSDANTTANGPIPSIDDDGFIKIEANHTQLKCLTKDPHAWRLARFRHRVETRHLASDSTSPKVEHTKLGIWIAERYPHLKFWSTSNLFDPTAPSPVRSKNYDFNVPGSSGLFYAKLTPAEIDLFLQIFFGPDHGLQSLLLTLEPADPRNFKILVVNQHAERSEIVFSTSHAAYDDGPVEK
jgi:hypothetical protein